jgi:DNA-binding CsgD family transcriptional regulator/PAS domain-containing protein
MVTIDDFSRIVSAIYGSALTPQQWESALHEMKHALQGTGSALLIPGAPTWYNSTLLVEATQTYREYYHRLDRVAATAERGPVGVVRTGTELMPLVRNSEFYEGWLRPFDIGDALIVRLTSAARPACLIVSAPKRTEPFDTAERVKLLSALVPHLQQALRTQDHLNDFAHRASNIAAAVDTVQHGIAVVGAGSTVVHLNAAAERILKGGDGLCIRSGNIDATCRSADAELRRSIAGALFEHKCGSRSGNSFVCNRPSGKRPYVIHVLPFSSATDDPSDGRALVVLVDPEQQPKPATSLLTRIYGLTRAEADIALRVLRGDGLKPISEELSLSMATVKTHLQHVFDKTDTHRQAELVRLLLTITP